jgi:hypothetical protein
LNILLKPIAVCPPCDFDSMATLAGAGRIDYSPF